MKDLPVELHPLTERHERPRLIGYLNGDDLTTERHDDPPLANSIVGAVWLDDKRLLSYCHEGPKLTLWDVHTGETLWVTEVPFSRVGSLHRAPGQNRVVVSFNKEFAVIDLEFGVSRLSLEGSVGACLVSPDGELLFVSVGGTSLSAYRLSDLSHLWEREHRGYSILAQTSDGLLAFATKNILRKHSALDGVPVTEYPFDLWPDETLLDVKARSDGRLLYATHYDKTEGDGHREVYDTIRCLDLNTGKNLWAREGSGYAPGSLCLGRSRVLWGENTCVKEYSYRKELGRFAAKILQEKIRIEAAQENGEVAALLSIEKRQLQSMAISPGGEFLSIVTTQNEILVFLLES